MRSQNLLSLLCIFALFSLCVGSISNPVLAAPDFQFKTPNYPPRPPDRGPSPTQSITSPSAPLALPPLKAVLLVGPIDGNEGDWTLSEIANMELAARVLENNGVAVTRFYPGVGTLEDIDTAAEGAHFLLYRGHGVYGGSMPSPNVGGFALSGGYYSPERIRNNLHLAPNAIVMLYGCFTAGSSSAEGDLYDIGIQEASRRVAQYSDPFLDIGAAGYYANWYGNAFERFLSSLFAGKTLGQTYEQFYDFNAATVFRTTHPDHPELAMWVDKDNWDYWKYDHAFAGKPDQTLVDLFKPATLGKIPGAIDFTVEVAEQTAIQPPAYIITPTNISADLPIQWSIDTSGDWYEASLIQGQSPGDSFRVVPTSYDTTKPGLYTGMITVTATSPQDTINPVQTISVNMEVKAAQLDGLPGSITFYYSIPDQETFTDGTWLRPRNTGSSLPLALSITTDSAWIIAFPPYAYTPQNFLISAGEFDTMTVASYTGVLTVTATSISPVPVYQSPQVIPVYLHIIDKPIFKNYLPLVFIRE